MKLRFVLELLLTALLVVGFVSYLVVPFTPPHFDYPEQPFPVVTPVVARGEPIVLWVTRCNYTSAPITLRVTRRLTSDDGQIIGLPAIDVDLAPGCERWRSLLNVVDQTTPPGRYTLNGTFTGINRWGKIVVLPWSTEAFTVALPPAGVGVFG